MRLPSLTAATVIAITLASQSAFALLPTAGRIGTDEPPPPDWLDISVTAEPIGRKLPSMVLLPEGLGTPETLRHCRSARKNAERARMAEPAGSSNSLRPIKAHNANFASLKRHPRPRIRTSRDAVFFGGLY